MLYFITGNKNKFEETMAVLGEGNVEQMDIDLPEVQDVDARNIIRAKLLEATNHHKGEFIVEDTSLYLDCLNGLPGPLIKWFLQTIGNDGLVVLADKFGNAKAEAKTMIGYAKSHEEVCFFEGSLNGKIVAPRGDFGFGWDQIFQPDGSGKTFGEMEREEKNSMSMRRMALNKLKDFLAGSDVV